MTDATTVLTILLMALVTYATRIGGYVALRNRSLSPRARAMLEATPGCVLISVIAPFFVTGEPAGLLALAVTLLAATRLPLLPTVLVGVGAAALLRAVIG
ncbi:AzlD family protein [Roseomonas hellenica]|uniref:AzlD family protein n=1 Tax=Plastoroseomonas hellenica TaxID=2687306 RepID=A0ABS5F5B7_9PROT|nr:AzlD family protein [Plastoroseomonas hellenica]MBR0667752.1 AzlD family protein [Plastoroseomonas hellenica]